VEGVCGSKFLVGWTLDVLLRSCFLVLCVLAFYPPAGSLISVCLRPIVHVHPPPPGGFSLSCQLLFPTFGLSPMTCNSRTHTLHPE